MTRPFCGISSPKKAFRRDTCKTLSAETLRGLKKFLADLQQTEDDTAGYPSEAQIALLTTTHTLLTDRTELGGAADVRTAWAELKQQLYPSADSDHASQFDNSFFAYKTAVQEALTAASDNGSYEESLEQAKKLVALAMTFDGGTVEMDAFAKALKIASESISTKNDQIKDLKSEIQRTNSRTWTYALLAVGLLGATMFGSSQRCDYALGEVSSAALVEAEKASQLCQSSVKDIASQCPGFNTGGLHLPIFPVFTTGSDAETITVEPESVPTVTGAPKTG